MSADLESESSGIVSDPGRALQGLSQLAASPDPPLQAIRLILSSYSFNLPENRKRPLEVENNRSKKTSGDSAKKWPCEICSHSYSTLGNLQRHVNIAHATKRRLVLTDVFECEDCDYTCATAAALETHMDTHASSATDLTSPKYKCALCSKTRTSIYNHYGSHHRIDYPEQILFDNGNALVRSDINSDSGKAPWFIKEKEKMSLYDNVTCRLCESKTRFDNPEMLAGHYTLYHMVQPEILDNLKHLFRAEKGAHLVGFASSQTPKRKQTEPTAREVRYRKDENTETHKDKATLKTHAKKSILHVVFNCNECAQVYATKALLAEHKKDKHAPKPGKAISVKYKCTFCCLNFAQIYKHYGNKHKIEYPEQILFDNGNILVQADINTNGGQAPWFLSEKEKSESRYTLNTCRLCETEYDTTYLLEMHYLTEHKVDPDVLIRLNNLRCLFRAKKGAHLVDLPADRAPKRQQRVSLHARPVNSVMKSSEVSSVHAEADVPGLIMYQCAECGVAATTCDISIEHAQLHHLTGYKPIPLTCDICSFAFEAQCYTDHSTHHLSRNQYKIVKFHPSKLLNEWSEMFEGLSESHANRIKASSTYRYTRRVKMNSEVVAGIPLYRCGMCELCVRPKDVEGHCYSKSCCVETQPQGHFCPECDIDFYSSAGLREHEKEHKIYGNDCFRKVTFNCSEDEILNRALHKLQSATVEKTPKIQGSNKQPIVVLENVVVRQFCNECKKSIWNVEFEAHAAMHKVNEYAFEHNSNTGSEKESLQEQNCLNTHQKQAGEIATRNVAIENEKGIEGAVEQWSSDSDSCKSLQVRSYAIQVDIHAQNETERENSQVVITNRNGVNATDVQTAANNSEMDLSFVQDITFEEFSEEMTNELKRDIEHLGFKEFGVDKNKWAYIPDDLHFLNDLENEIHSSYSDSNKSVNAIISQDIFSYPDMSQYENANLEISPDIFSAKTQARPDAENNVNLANTANVGKVLEETNKEIGVNTVNESGDLVSNPRPSSRVILDRMLSND